MMVGEERRPIRGGQGVRSVQEGPPTLEYINMAYNSEIWNFVKNVFSYVRALILVS